MPVSGRMGEFEVGRAPRARKAQPKKGGQKGEGVLGELGKIGLSAIPSVASPIAKALAEKLGNQLAKKIKGNGMYKGKGMMRGRGRISAVPGTMQRGNAPVQMGASFKLAGQGEKKKKAVVHLPL